MSVRAYGQVFIQPTIPNEDPVMVGSLWVDTAGAALKRCTAVSPYTFVDVSGGGGGASPSATVAALDGTGDAGAATEYSRGDHKHADANRPADGEKAALAGTSGTPGVLNKYVTDGDARMTNARTPTTHATTHAAAGSDPLTLSESQITNLGTDLAAKAPTTRSLTAGAGLTGGGDLSADRTFTVGAGTGVTVNADDVEVKYGTIAGTAAQGNDARLSDLRNANMANPTASVGIAAVNGAATTAMRSDGAPALDQAIAPTWSAAHLFKKSTNSTTAFRVQDKDGNAILNIDTTNKRVGIGTEAPGFKFQVVAATDGVGIRLNNETLRYRSDFGRSTTELNINSYDDTGAVYQDIRLNGKDIYLDPVGGTVKAGRYIELTHATVPFLRLIRTDATARTWDFNGGDTFAVTDATAGATRLSIDSAGIVRMAAYGAGAATFDAGGTISSVSDERLKHIAGYYTTGLRALKHIQPIAFRWNELSGLERDHLNVGFSAQNVAAVAPELVGVDPRGFLTNPSLGVVALLVNAVKELLARLEKAEAKLERIV